MTSHILRGVAFAWVGIAAACGQQPEKRYEVVDRKGETVGYIIFGEFDQVDDGGTTDEGGYPLKLGTMNYGIRYYEGWHDYTTEQVNAILEWQAAHTDIIVGGRDPTGHAGNAMWMSYGTASAYWWRPRYHDYYTWCQTNGYTFEDLWLHMTENFTGDAGWSGLDRFGCFEGEYSTGNFLAGAATNGVICDSGSVLTDNSDAAYGSGTFSFTDYLYLGYDLPFDRADFTFSISGINVEGEWQYYNGSTWTTLTVTDGTSAFTTDGQISFTPPNDWSRVSVNSSWSKYFVRYNLTGGTPPTINTITGDDWACQDGTHECRGWDSTDENIINSGELAYNPDPPVSASARFRHQGRATGYWTTGQLSLNKGNLVDGDSVAGLLLAHFISDEFDTTNCSGIMFDSVGIEPSGYISDPSGDILADHSDFSEFTELSFLEADYYYYESIVAANHADDPNFLLGGNTPYVGYASRLDWSYYEMANPVSSNGAVGIMEVASNVQRYDHYEEANNANGKIGLFMLQDVTDDPYDAYWDRGNRGPMVALATHYIASNDNTYLDYFTNGGWRYDDTDEIYVWDSGSTTLAEAIEADLSDDVKTITLASTANLPASVSAGCGYGAGFHMRHIKIGDDVLILDDAHHSGYTIVNGTQIQTTEPIYNSAEAGATVRWLSSSSRDHMSNYAGSGYPSYADVYRYANYFPAMFVDIGIPDTNGWNGGQRGKWQTDVWRRDFANAVCVFREITDKTTANYSDSASYSLGANYKPLRSDGTWGDNISEITLRQCEGAILEYVGAGPTVTSAAIGSDGTTITVTCSEDVLPATGIAGFSISGASNATVASAVSSGRTIFLVLTGAVVAGETITLNYSGGNVTDTSSPALQLNTFNDFAVTNNSGIASVSEDVVIEAVSSAVNTSTDETSLTCDFPVGTSAGDLLVAIIACNWGRSITTPSGWTRELVTSPSGAKRLYVFSKVADAGDAGSQTFEGSNIYFSANMTMLRVSGAIQSLVADGVDIQRYGSVIACPDIATTRDKSLVISAMTAWPGAASTLSEATELYDYDDDYVYLLSVYSEIVDAAGDFTGRTIQLDAAATYASAATIAILPKLVAAP